MFPTGHLFVGGEVDLHDDIGGYKTCMADNELVATLVETADSPEHAVASAVLTFAAVLNDILKVQAEEYLQAILLSDEND